MSDRDVLQIMKLGAPPWITFDPFLFCVHHKDGYPPGNAAQGPDVPLTGRNIGSDFGGKDGWSMYHGDVVPGFPRHPHRGFETVTVSRAGFIDHSDSMGATARYGGGDVQWMTAGRGIVHAEMFPLRDQAKPNPTELFQIWINLPASHKMVEPYFSMFWHEKIPTLSFGEGGARTKVVVVAGALGTARPPAPPPNSWASNPRGEVAIWSIEMDPGASWTLPAGPAGVHRTLYFFAGSKLEVGERTLGKQEGARLRSEAEVRLVAGPDGADVLVLQGRPIGEPVSHYGPFVMNEAQEIQQAILDYRRTQFGGWPWSQDDPVHAREQGRFAKHADGRVERAEG